MKKKLKCKKKIDKYIAILRLVAYNRFYRYEGRNDELFDQRNLVAMNLKNCIRDRGFTKISLAKKANISRPTLDKILNGSIDNKSTFDKHLQKILAVLNLSVDDLVFFEAKPKTVDVVYSENAPNDYQMNKKAQKQYGLLMDVLDLCEIYY